MTAGHQTLSFNQLHVERFGGENLSAEAVLVLHGYPSDMGDKNRDIAGAIYERTGMDAYIFHYRGLGLSSGEFSFTRSIEDALAFHDSLASRYKQVHVVGHSWGGLVGVNLFAKRYSSNKRLVLMSPFTFIPPGDYLKALVEKVYAGGDGEFEVPKFIRANSDKC